MALPFQQIGIFSFTALVVEVEVDTETGAVELLDYVICEDGGTRVGAVAHQPRQGRKPDPDGGIPAPPT